MITKLLNYASVCLFSAVLLVGLASPSWAQIYFPHINPVSCAAFPVVISQPGSYVLNRNLTVPWGCGKDAILVTSDDVTIDLNGFTLKGPCNAEQGCDCSAFDDRRGINADDQDRVTIKNGTIKNMWDDGISAGEECTVQNVRALNSCGEGIICDEGSLIKDNIVRDNSGCGIEAGDGSFVVGNVIADNAEGECGYQLEFNNAKTGYRSNVISFDSGSCVSGGTSLGENICNGGTPF